MIYDIFHTPLLMLLEETAFGCNNIDYKVDVAATIYHL